MKSFRRWFGGQELKDYINYFKEKKAALPPFLFLCPYEKRNNQDGWMIPCDETDNDAENWTNKDKDFVQKANKYLANINRIHNN